MWWWCIQFMLGQSWSITDIGYKLLFLWHMPDFQIIKPFLFSTQSSIPMLASCDSTLFEVNLTSLLPHPLLPKHTSLIYTTVCKLLLLQNNTIKAPTYVLFQGVHPFKFSAVVSPCSVAGITGPGGDLSCPWGDYAVISHLRRPGHGKEH